MSGREMGTVRCRRFLGPLAALVLVSACGEPRAYPLRSAGKVPVSQLARLKGPIASVDGEDVSTHGDLFVLPAGCHVVTTVSEWSDNDGQMGVTVHLRPSSYAMAMRPGHHYVVRFFAGTSNAVTASFSMSAVEEDANGDVVRKLEPASPAELAACRAGSNAAS